MSQKRSTSKRKAKTLQQRFGFMDEDKKRPQHDETMLWLDANMESIIRSLEGDDWDQENIWRQIEYHRSQCGEMPPPPPKPAPVIKEKTWEWGMGNTQQE